MVELSIYNNKKNVTFSSNMNVDSHLYKGESTLLQKGD